VTSARCQRANLSRRSSLNSHEVDPLQARRERWWATPWKSPVIADGTSESDVPHPESKSGTERRHPGHNGSAVRGAGLSPIRRAKGRSRRIADDIRRYCRASCRARGSPDCHPRGCGRRFLGPRDLAPSAPRQTLDGCAELPLLVDDLSSRIHPTERQASDLHGDYSFCSRNRPITSLTASGWVIGPMWPRFSNSTTSMRGRAAVSNRATPWADGVERLPTM